MKRSSFICKGGGLSRNSVWQALLAKGEAGGQSLRLLLLLPVLVMFGLLLGSAGAWAADVTANVTTVAVTPATPAPGGTVTVTFTLNAAAAVGDTITYTNTGTAVAADFNPSGLPSGTFTVTAAGGSQVMTLTLSATATTGNTVNVTSNVIAGTAATITASSAGIAITAPASITEGAATADFPITITETLDGTHTVTCTRTDAAGNITNLVATPSSIATGETATAISVNTSTAVTGDTIACTIGAGGTDTITGSPASVVVTAGSGSTITITAPATIAVGDTTAAFTYDVAGVATTAATTVACTYTGGTATPTPATIAIGAPVATGTAISVALTPAVAAGNTVECTLTNTTDTVVSPASATEGTVTPPPVGTAPDIHLLVSDGNPPDLFPNPATPPSTTRCVDFGYVSATENVVRQFAVGNISLSTAPSLVASTVFQPSPDLAFQQQNAANLGGITLNTTTVPTTAPAGVGYFEVAFNASLLSPQPSSLPMVINRTLVVSSNDPDTAAGTIYVPLVATVIPSKLPKVQVADSTTAVPPAGTDISNGTPTAVQFTPSAVSSGTTVTRNFSIKNGGYEMLAIAPTTATFTPDASTTAGVFTINPFTDEADAGNTDTSSVTISPPPPQGCNTSGNTTDYSKMNITFTAPTVIKQTTFGGTVCLKSNDSLTTTTATVDFCFPVTATVYPPPPLNPEIDVYDGTTHIPNLDTTGIDFGSTAVGSPVQRTITVKNPSAVDLTVFDFSSNLPTGFSLLNANYASKIPSGGSTNLIFQCDATAAGSFGAAQTTCASNPLGAGCSLRVPSNDGDNVTWEFNGTRPSENPYTFPMKCVVTGGTTANISLNLTPPTNGVVVSDSGGISCGTGSTTCTADYPPSTAVKLTATADTGATFTSWGGDCGTGTTSPLTVTMDAAKNCTATFTISGGGQVTKFPLNITTPSKGVVASDSGGINCGTGGSVCTGNYDPSTLVKLTATADSGANFTGWGGDCTGTASPLDVMMDKAKNCTATFEAIVVTTDVTLTITPPTEGNIMSSTGGINCGTAGTACTATYSKGDTVQLVAAGTGKMLDAWGGDCAGNNNPLSITMDANKTCSATFTTGSGTVTQTTLTITPPVGGSITSSAGGINCGTSGSICVANYAPNASVTLTAIPDSGKVFSSWGGACTGTATTATVTMDAAKTCTATFTTSGGTTPPPPPPGNQQLTVTKVGTGTITSDVGGINCGLICSASYTTGSIVRLTASGGTFSGWSGSCSGTSATTVVTMDAAKNCTATFSGGTTDPGTTDPNVTDCFNQGGIFADGVCLPASTLQPGAVDASGAPINVTVSMRGGISKNSGPYFKESTVVLADPIATRGVIQVDPVDVGKKVDIIVAGIHYSTEMYTRGFEWYMLEGCNTCVKVWPYSDRDAAPILSQLTALKTVDVLPSTLVIDMYSGHFVFPGFLDIFYGYRVVGSGKVVFNADPIKVTINP